MNTLAAVLEEAVVAGNNLIDIFGSLSYAWLRKKKELLLDFLFYIGT